MGENSQQMIFLSACMILFIAACLITLSLMGQVNGTIHEVGSVIQGQTRSVIDHSQGANTIQYSGAEVVIMIHDNNDAELAIDVGGHIFHGLEDHDAEDLRNINLHNQYEMEYVRNSVGRILRISFNEVNEEAGKP